MFGRSLVAALVSIGALIPVFAQDAKPTPGPILLTPPMVGTPRLPDPDEDFYEMALLAAVHRFASEGESVHLRAMLEKHPEFATLHLAADVGHLDVVKLLVESGAKLETGAMGIGYVAPGWTPLHLAASAGHLEVVKFLVERGANIRALTTALPERADLGGPCECAAPRPQRILSAVPARSILDVAQVAAQRQVVAFLTAKLRDSAPPSSK